MKHSTLTNGLALVALGLLIASCAPMASQDANAPGKMAPDLSLKMLNGSTVQLSSLKGSVVVLDFWATWCGPCKASLPNLAKVSSDPALAARGLKVIAVNCRDPQDTTQQYIDQNHLPLTVALDLDGSAEDAYKVDGIPATIVIGRDGTIQHAIVGFGGQSTEDELNAAIEKALAAPVK